MYMHFDDIDGEESKEPIGITVTHVDDVLSVESTEFNKNVKDDVTRMEIKEN